MASEGIVASVADANTKTFGDGPAFYLQLAMQNAVQTQQLAAQNAVAAQQAANVIMQSAMAAAANTLVSVDPSQAVSEGKLIQSGLSTDAVANALAAAISQILTKSAGNTPPVTP